MVLVTHCLWHGPLIGVCWYRRQTFYRQCQTPDLGWPSHAWLSSGSLHARCRLPGNLIEHRAPHSSRQMVWPTMPVVQIQWTVSGRWVGVRVRSRLKPESYPSLLLVRVPSDDSNAVTILFGLSFDLNLIFFQSHSELN